jgi:hypothetical protein
MTIKMNKGLAVKYVEEFRVSYYENQGWSKDSNDKTAEVTAVLKPARKTVKPRPAVEDAVIMDAFDEEVGIKDELTKGDL